MAENNEIKKYLGLDGLGALVTQIKSRYDGTVASIEKGTTENGDANVIYFNAVNGTNVYKLDTTDFIKDGMLSSVSVYEAEEGDEIPGYDNITAGEKFLKFVWNTDAGDIDPDNSDVYNIIYIKISELGINDAVLNGLNKRIDDAAAAAEEAATKADAATNAIAAWVPITDSEIDVAFGSTTTTT